MKAKQLLMLGWFFLLYNATNGTYSTQGPFPSKTMCAQITKQVTEFCHHGGSIETTENGDVTKCSTASFMILEQPCWEVK